LAAHSIRRVVETDDRTASIGALSDRPPASSSGESQRVGSGLSRSSSEGWHGSRSAALDSPSRSRRWPWVVSVVIVIVVAAVVVRLITLTPPNLVVRAAFPMTVRLPGSGPKPAWPAEGQAMLVVPGIGSLGSAGGDEPRPIASLAKVMTAYLTLTRYPLSATGGGFTLTVTPADVRSEVQDAKHDESVVAVRAGERLNERQLLEALLIPSGNNIARMLAAYEAGSVSRFVAEMNGTARMLGMDKTTYTDPSGYDPTTVSDASDQLRVFERASRFGVFRQIVSMPSAAIPVAGTVKNYDPLISAGYYGKTGSDSEAEGCLAFFKDVTVAGRRLTMVGVVLGQGVGSTTSVILGAAAAAAQRLVASVAPAIRARSVLPARTAVIIATSADGHRVRAVTTGPLRVIGWGGIPETLTVRARSLATDHLSADEIMGQAALTGSLPTPATGLTRTVVRAPAALAAPGISWRLAHLL
jgi:serine-type D-Ala-D-Ala carboxypeptidase (penicillin-binding protein 5/6)